jgi:enterochelin esterase-like enzyme
MGLSALALAISPDGLSAQATGAVPAGTLERIRVHGSALEGNLSGDDPTRDVVVHLPPSYDDEPTRRYPVVYFLHGYSVGVEVYVRMTRLPVSPDRAIVVMVDQYVSSLVTYRAIALDIGDEDGGLDSSRELSEQLTRLGIDHSFEVYEGTHTSRVGERFETSVVPFFSEHLGGDGLER